MARYSILHGINDQPNDVVPPTVAQSMTPPPSADKDQAATPEQDAFDVEMGNAIDVAEEEVDNIAAQNPYADANVFPAHQIVHIPLRSKVVAYETIIHAHLTNPAYGSCYNRPVGYLIGLEIGQDIVAEEKQVMFKTKADLAKLITIREGLIGALQQVLDNSGDPAELHIRGNGATVVRDQHVLAKNEEASKEDKAIEASHQNLKRRQDEMLAENEETVQFAKRLKTHINSGGVVMCDEPLDLEKNEGLMSHNIRQAVEIERQNTKILLENELRTIHFYKRKVRESEARYKDLCRSHMLIYLELKREGWELIPKVYRRPGYWFH